MRIILATLSVLYCFFSQNGYSAINLSTVYVTNLNDSGIGSLREALILGNRNIVFKTQGTIKLNTPIVIKDLAYINLAFPEDTQIENQGIYISNSHNINLNNLRIRFAAKYGLLITNGAHDIVVDHASIENSSQSDVEFGKNVDINNSSYNITIKNSIIAYVIEGVDVLNIKYKGMLVTDNNMTPAPTKITLFNNLFYNNFQRSPQFSSPGELNMTNNVIYGWGSYGTRVRNKAISTLSDNLYLNPQRPNKEKDALILAEGTTNVLVGNMILKNQGFECVALDQSPNDKTCSLLQRNKDSYGALPRDAFDNIIMTDALQALPAL
ncbi:pectate lyase family protein [Cysteiniphilum litorale]|uniref:pectate lyase family protein n=1 Tax=Cysteiniphilum litorale TaxID=2056700 RepID=UPI003F882FF9